MLGRRNFIFRFFQWALAASIRPRIAVAGPVDTGEFHFHPHYRTPPPLDALALKIDAGLDDLPAEKQHDWVAAILAQWCTSLRESLRDFSGIEAAFGPNFLGASLKPLASKLTRPGQALEVLRITFAPEAALRAAAFLDHFQRGLSGF